MELFLEIQGNYICVPYILDDPSADLEELYQLLGLDQCENVPTTEDELVRNLEQLAYLNTKTNHQIESNNNSYHMKDELPVLRSHLDERLLQPVSINQPYLNSDFPDVANYYQTTEDHNAQPDSPQDVHIEIAPQQFPPYPIYYSTSPFGTDQSLSSTTSLEDFVPTFSTSLLPESNNKFACECGRQFRDKCYLRQHKAAAHQILPYRCTKCGKKFADEKLLVKHMIKHYGKKAFQCPHCPKSYVYSSDCARHMRAHLGNVQHKCVVCDMSFSRKDQLVSHLKTRKHIKNTGVILSPQKRRKLKA